MALKTKYTITKKWEQKIAEMKVKANFKYNILLSKKKSLLEQEYKYECLKNEKKKAAYIKKKEDEYKRKMRNEIRDLEGKPKKEYKTPAPKINPIQFAMAIAQENARLRDTDADGNGPCISHATHKTFSWGELAGGHRYSRKVTGVCLEKENINAQCHACNFTTGPRGDTVAKEKTNQIYDENIDKKYGPGTAEKLRTKVAKFFQGKLKKYDLDMEIPKLIDENEALWKTKNFYKPAKKWREIWTKYAARK